MKDSDSILGAMARTMCPKASSTLITQCIVNSREEVHRGEYEGQLILQRQRVKE